MLSDRKYFPFERTRITAKFAGLLKHTYLKGKIISKFSNLEDKEGLPEMLGLNIYRI
jgi:hypothetical protein